MQYHLTSYIFKIFYKQHVTEDMCIGVTMEPESEMWSLRSGPLSDPNTPNEQGATSMLNDCIESELTKSGGK